MIDCQKTFKPQQKIYVVMEKSKEPIFSRILLVILDYFLCYQENSENHKTGELINGKK